VILPGLSPGSQGETHQIMIKPLSMLNKAKKRICPSLSVSNWANIFRHPSGDANGNNPSITNTKAIASQMVSLLKIYFFAFPAGATPPRITLKNSEVDGSSTITSFLLAKLAL
jgi:hypothetical protein